MAQVTSSDIHEIYERVVQCIGKVLKTRQSTNGRNAIIQHETDIFQDLGIDSLESLDLMNILEDEFGVSPNQYDIAKVRTVDQIVDYVAGLMKYKSS